MVDVKKYVTSVILDLRYTTVENFMHRQLYPKIQSTYLRLPAVRALQIANEEFLKKNFTIKIFDAYRPYSVTEEMWDQVHDARYAADPAKGSGHNRGIAVDITLVDLDTGDPLAMGTEFDNFSDTAHTEFIHLPSSILENRHLLVSTMKNSGFESLDTEWWHFYLPDAEKFDLLDLSFRQLDRLTKDQQLN